MIKDIEISKSLGFEDLALHHKISILKISEDNYDQGIWQKKRISPNWKEIIKLCEVGLQKSRDLTLFFRFLEAKTIDSGLLELDEGIALLINFLKDKYYPLDEEYQDRLFTWFDQKLPIIAFYDHMKNNLSYNHYSSEKLNQHLNSIYENLNKLPFAAENFKNIIINIKKKLENEIKIQQQEKKSDNLSEFKNSEENQDNLTNLLNVINNLIPEEKDKLKKLLLNL